MQIVTFMVMAIIGAVFAFIQVCVAGDGAGKIHRVYDDSYLDADCGDSRCKKVFLSDLCREKRCCEGPVSRCRLDV